VGNLDDLRIFLEASDCMRGVPPSPPQSNGHLRMIAVDLSQFHFPGRSEHHE